MHCSRMPGGAVRHSQCRDFRRFWEGSDSGRNVIGKEGKNSCFWGSCCKLSSLHLAADGFQECLPARVGWCGIRRCISVLVHCLQVGHMLNRPSPCPAIRDSTMSSRLRVLSLHRICAQAHECCADSSQANRLMSILIEKTCRLSLCNRVAGNVCPLAQ